MARGARLALACAAMLAPRAASGEPDNRPTDRFFFALGAGRQGIFGPSPEGGHTELVPEISYWPDDYVGVSMETNLSGFTNDWGLTPVVAVPLRYLQPYAGAFLGLRNENQTATGRPYTGVDWHAHLVLGANGYASRNLRVYVQWEDPPFARLGDSHRQSLIGGVRWSPDFFHAERAVTKLDMVWWAGALTFVTWGIAGAAQ